MKKDTQRTIAIQLGNIKPAEWPEESLQAAFARGVALEARRQQKLAASRTAAINARKREFATA